MICTVQQSLFPGIFNQYRNASAPTMKFVREFLLGDLWHRLDMQHCLSHMNRISHVEDLADMLAFPSSNPGAEPIGTLERWLFLLSSAWLWTSIFVATACFFSVHSCLERRYSYHQMITAITAATPIGMPISSPYVKPSSSSVTLLTSLLYLPKAHLW